MDAYFHFPTSLHGMVLNIEQGELFVFIIHDFGCDIEKGRIQ
jgi:hypothetical protein